MTNKVGGPTDPGKREEVKTLTPDHRRIEKVEKVRKIDEVENERTRKKFSRFMNDEEEEGVGNKGPSPLETTFYALNGESKGKPIPSPAYSQPPNVGEAPSLESTHGEDPLPHAKQFWKGVDAPPEKPSHQPQYLETGLEVTGYAGKKKPSANEKEVLEKEMEALKEHEGKSSSGKEKKQTGLKGEVPIPKEHLVEERGGKGAAQKGKGPVVPQVGRDAEQKQHRPSSMPVGKKVKKDEGIKSAALPAKGRKEAMVKQRGENGKGAHQRVFEIPSHLPAQVTPLAQAAVEQAAPYLAPEMLSLFYQMVGTIYVLAARSGVARTEVLLNAQAFSKSQFYGAKIIIEKYSTAPDSLNIRLTGSDQAVAAFNKNIPGLMNAFRKGNFGFRIGRIDAEYSSDRPVLRRKRSGEGGSEMGGGDFDDGRRS